MELNDLIQRVADSALSIVILTAWLLSLIRQNARLQERIDLCISRFEYHLENHEQIEKKN